MRAKNKKVSKRPSPVKTLEPFALQVLLKSDVSFDMCSCTVETIKGEKTNIYSLPTDQVVADLLAALRNLLASFRERRGRFKTAYEAVVKLGNVKQMEAMGMALLAALNSKEFRKAQLKQRKDAKSALNDLNQHVVSETEYSKFRPLRNAGTAKEYRPRDRNQFDRPKESGRRRMFKPLEPSREQRLVRGEQPVAQTVLDPYYETDVIIPSDFSAWQLRRLIKALS